MNIFSKLMSRIFDKSPKKAEPAAQTSAEPAAASPAPAAGTASPALAKPAEEVDVAAILDRMKAEQSEDLDWRKSIVDLMKLLGLDSSFSERKELAAELGYSGDTGDSAAMNIWLHKQVLRKLSENGGKVPADLLG